MNTDGGWAQAKCQAKDLCSMVRQLKFLPKWKIWQSAFCFWQEPLQQRLGVNPAHALRQKPIFSIHPLLARDGWSRVKPSFWKHLPFLPRLPTSPFLTPLFFKYSFFRYYITVCNRLHLLCDFLLNFQSKHFPTPTVLRNCYNQKTAIVTDSSQNRKADFSGRIMRIAVFWL